MSISLLVTCILETLPQPTQRAWARAYLPLQYIKSYNEEHVYQMSTKSPSLSVGLFVTCISETLHHPSPKDGARAYLPLQYFKLANEEHMYQV
ncbi:hypothetical protein AVEN_174392-1 [Araneus ventricosus]|uniref:Uncharacterized protein n=1 Tax=Araneus ventricosus TaxID=182803 RepID=A0A4Y2H2E0_ARAVE|nr:hypothetical protein AVEN_21300-1 [Araneus ventricosus]GBM59258.1 hypothetical protein AVEN_60368-1 [Araneus ventricosus]GBM59264.1 hypothetical protein AVEN_68190-1 [Araneus ventricosus]GBM59291.1 hypothetical protein AVEN_174392-1 [Araneus ventricosus]